MLKDTRILTYKVGSSSSSGGCSSSGGSSTGTETFINYNCLSDSWSSINVSCCVKESLIQMNVATKCVIIIGAMAVGVSETGVDAILLVNVCHRSSSVTICVLVGSHHSSNTTFSEINNCDKVGMQNEKFNIYF